MSWSMVSAIATVIILFVAIGGFYYTDIQIQQAKITTANLEQLVNKSSEQLETLNLAITEIAHQTIMQVYQDGLPYRVEVATCNYNEKENNISYRLIVYDKNVKPSTIKFKIKTYFSFYTVGENNERHHIINLDRYDIIYEPGIQKTLKFSLAEVFEQTKDVKDEILYVKASFEFAPYSDAKNIVMAEDDDSERPSYLNAFAKSDDQNIWINLPKKENIICN